MEECRADVQLQLWFAIGDCIQPVQSAVQELHGSQMHVINERKLALVRRMYKAALDSLQVVNC